jgi:hypothetical protein
MRTQKTTVGIFHRDELNRKALIELLGKNYNCEEIERWEEVANSTAKVLVIAAPELLTPEVSFDEVKRVINAQNASVIMINNDDRKWWIYRLKFIQLRNPSIEQTLKSIEKLCPERKLKHLFFGKEIRA